MAAVGGSYGCGRTNWYHALGLTNKNSKEKTGTDVTEDASAASWQEAKVD